MGRESIEGYLYALSFAYQSKSSDKWGPIPDIYQRNYSSVYGRWDYNFRKPRTGMLLDFIREFNVNCIERVLMIGDSEDDFFAASAAGCKFVNADTFFNR